MSASVTGSRNSKNPAYIEEDMVKYSVGDTVVLTENYPNLVKYPKGMQLVVVGYYDDGINQYIRVSHDNAIPVSFLRNRFEKHTALVPKAPKIDYMAITREICGGQ